jgi:dethiobiotin synthetase
MLIIVSGTGTEIGKTHFTCGLAKALGTFASVAALKPIESGVPEGREGEDGLALRLVSTTPVAPPPYQLRAPLSPHRAGSLEGIAIDEEIVRRYVQSAAAEITIVELPGGLFSPLSKATTNADLAARLSPDVLLLVAPNRLGVLHDVGATLRAATTVPLAVSTIVLVAAAVPDNSFATNAGDLIDVAHGLPILEIPRGSTSAIGDLASVRRLARDLSERRGRVRA